MFGRLKELARSGFLKLLKPLAKKGVIQLVQREGDKLQNNVGAALVHQGPEAVDKLFDSWQARILSGLNTLQFLPDWIRHHALRIVQDEGDKMQQRVKDAALNGGPRAVDLVFDHSQRLIIERINAL